MTLSRLVAHRRVTRPNPGPLPPSPHVSILQTVAFTPHTVCTASRVAPRVHWPSLSSFIPSPRHAVPTPHSPSHSSPRYVPFSRDVPPSLLPFALAAPSFPPSLPLRLQTFSRTLHCHRASLGRNDLDSVDPLAREFRCPRLSSGRLQLERSFWTSTCVKDAMPEGVLREADVRNVSCATSQTRTPNQ